jgi:hypothetical protein
VMERPEVQLYLQTPYVGGVLPKTGIVSGRSITYYPPLYIQ